MTYTPVIYDWPRLVEPINQTFRAGGTSVAGGMTLGGISVENPEPGGRGELTMDFPPFANEDVNLAASWIMSRILNGAIMRIRLFSPSVQLLADSVFGIDTASGVMWSNGLGWSEAAWAADPRSNVITGGAKGATSLIITTTALGETTIKVGHVIGFNLNGFDFTHIITDVVLNQGGPNRARITVSPPLRRQVFGTDVVKYRPAMLVTCINAREVAANFRLGRVVQLNSARFVEALV
jgi:hypothetical protein